MQRLLPAPPLATRADGRVVRDGVGHDALPPRFFRELCDQYDVGSCCLGVRQLSKTESPQGDLKQETYRKALL